MTKILEERVEKDPEDKKPVHPYTTDDLTERIMNDPDFFSGSFIQLGAIPFFLPDGGSYPS